MVDDDTLERLSDERAGEARAADLIGEVRRDANVPGQRGAGIPADLVSVALHRRAYDRGSQPRTDIPGHRHVREARAETDGCASAARGAVEVRVQVREVDRALRVLRQAAENVLGRSAGLRVRFLGERESGGAASALEPGD